MLREEKSYDVGKLNCKDSTSVHYLESVETSKVQCMRMEEEWQVVKDVLVQPIMH